MAHKVSRVDWTTTPKGADLYREARADAQKQANATGFDYGLERNDLFMEFRVFMLPQKRNRCGHELHCEVVMCESIERMQSGHGCKP